MKSSLNYSFLIFCFVLVFANRAAAQEKTKVSFLISANSKDKNIKLHGKLVAINDTALVVSDKKNVLHYLPFQKIGYIRIDKNRNDLGFGIVTAAAVGTNIALALQIDDAFTSILVGALGTVGIIGVMTIVHEIIHPAVLKIRAKDLTLTRDDLMKQLNSFVAKPGEVYP